MYLIFLDKISNMVDAKVNECYFAFEKLIMFLILLEHEEFLRIYFAYDKHFPDSFVAGRYFH